METKQQEQKPKVGVGIMVFKDGKILLHQRKGSHGSGEYSFPGGHLEYMETFEECAKREIKEECGINVKNIRFQFLANVKKYAPKHYVHIGLIADWEEGEPKVFEPDKVEGQWQWHEMDDLPQPLFEMCSLAINALKEKKNYYDNV